MRTGATAEEDVHWMNNHKLLFRKKREHPVPFPYNQAIKWFAIQLIHKTLPFFLSNTHTRAYTHARTHTQRPRGPGAAGSCYAAPQGSTDKPGQLTGALRAELRVIFIICVDEASAE